MRFELWGLKDFHEGNVEPFMKALVETEPWSRQRYEQHLGKLEARKWIRTYVQIQYRRRPNTQLRYNLGQLSRVQQVPRAQ